MTTKLLLADDSITIQKVVSLTFASEDVVIESYTDGNLALERARSIMPDIVLADVFMPGRNGYEVCAAIKSDPVLAGVPVVLLVGTFEVFDEAEAMRVQCDAHLVKPFDSEELIQTVHDLVAQHALRQPATPIDSAARPKKPAGAVACETSVNARPGKLVSNRTRESFLGANRILDLFDFPSNVPESVEPQKEVDREPILRIEASEPPTPKALEEAPVLPAATPPHVIPFPGARAGGSDAAPIALTEEMMDVIVEKVVKRLSQDIVREIAWEVVPELSEIMIRQVLDELGTPHKAQ